MMTKNIECKECIYCGKKFYKPITCSKREWKTRKFCSRVCCDLKRRKYSIIKKVCLYCKKEFFVKSSRINTSKFCNKSCHGKYSYKLNNKLDKIDTRNLKICVICKNQYRTKGKGKEHSKTCSYKCAGKYRSLYIRGENHPNFVQGSAHTRALRNTEEYNNWRFSVYKRDFYTCRTCNKHCRKKDIVAHHIKSFKDFPDLRFDIENGVTLCRSCHKKEHYDIGIKTRFKRVAAITCA